MVASYEGISLDHLADHLIYLGEDEGGVDGKGKGKGGSGKWQ